MTSLVIRPARIEEVPVLTELIRASVEGLASSDYSPGQIASALTHLFGVDTRLIEDGTYYAVDSAGGGEGERIVACGGWSRRRPLFGGDQYSDRSDDRLDPATEAARIRAFFVRPEAARRGIGSRILEECERAARSEGFCRLELMATLTGVPLYERCGFRAMEPVDLPLPGGVSFPLLRMSRPIPAP